MPLRVPVAKRCPRTQTISPVVIATTGIQANHMTETPDSMMVPLIRTVVDRRFGAKRRIESIHRKFQFSEIAHALAEQRVSKTDRK